MVQASTDKLIMGNWKMHTSREQARDLATQIVAHMRSHPPQCEVAICPPTLWLEVVMAEMGDSFIALGAQDCASQPKEGAHTGDVSAWMLANFGCDYVIVGHSERRTNHGEDNLQVKRKATSAIEHGVAPVICVGEQLEQRQAGHAMAVVESQLLQSIPDVLPDNLVIAYEPVWAIGTGEVPTNADIADMHAAIHTRLRAEKGDDFGLRVLYGGSVKPHNAEEILSIDGVDGALIGGASLDSDSFLAIIEAVK